VNALADPEVGKYLDQHFVAAFQRVGTFRIVGAQKQGGNVATYFCAPDGRVIHAIAGPVNAATLLAEAKWTVDTVRAAIAKSKGDGIEFKAMIRRAHSEKLRAESGLVVEPVTFDPPANGDDGGPLSYSDPTGRPLSPKLPLPPVEGPDVKFRLAQERAVAAGGAAILDRRGGRWALGNQGRVDMLLAAHSLQPIEKLYGAIFEGILGERITTRPVEIVTPFPWQGRADKGSK
jgi:hypothetical protein